MKNLMIFSSLLLFLILNACDGKKALNVQSCSCSASSIWASCSATCPYVNGACTAVCTSPSFAAGLVGSMPSCGCGAAGVGAAASDATVFVSDENVGHIKSIRTFLGGIKDDEATGKAIDAIGVLQEYYQKEPSAAEVEQAVKDIAVALDNLKEETKERLEKHAFSNLSEEEKVNVVTAKLDALIEQSFPEEEKILLKALKVQMPLYLQGKANEVSALASHLAQLIPQEDFEGMFYKRTAYQYIGAYSGNETASIALLKDLDEANFNPVNGEPLALPDCYCRWLCPPASTTEGCQPTKMGCGFLFTQPCTRW